jgi:hypothetical protein
LTPISPPSRSEPLSRGARPGPAACSFTAGFDTFEDYCRKRWDMAPTTAYQTIGSAQVSAIADIGTGVAEWTIRPLAKLLNEDGEGGGQGRAGPTLGEGRRRSGGGG